MPAQSGTVVAAASFATTPDQTLLWDPKLWLVRATVGTADVSFDGVNVALTIGTADLFVSLPVNFTRLWVRQNGGAATLRWSAIG